MTKKNSNITIHTYQSIFIIFLVVLMIFFELSDIRLFENVKDSTMVANSIQRFLGGIVLVVIIFGSGYSWIFRFKNIWKSFLIIIPSLIISINNFPIIAFFDGRTTLEEPVYRIYLFLLECLSIGFFEEIIFRGIILVFLLKKFTNQKHRIFLSIFISSFLFGLIHISNLYSGASIGDTFLQIGYSFLVGMMWAVMFLKTGNLWLTMVLHATFNFFGQVMFYLGHVNGRYDFYTIWITIVLALGVAGYSIILYKQLGNQPFIELS